MKQRACIAIAIALKPSLIIADEPTSALDVITQRLVMKTLCSVQERIGCGLILIGHDMGLMAQVADRMIVMQDGRIAEDAPVGELFRAPQHPYSRMLIDSVPSLGERGPAAAGQGRAGRRRPSRCWYSTGSARHSAAGCSPVRPRRRWRPAAFGSMATSRASSPSSDNPAPARPRWRG